MSRTGKGCHFNPDHTVGLVKQLSKYNFFDEKNWIPVSRTGIGVE
ncbi:hypothetical protein [Wolbachia endosymbiont of Atemnus politus]|nr:hypothetical protein [Wolbachia endosymbiont of Atemnus politus]